MTTTSNDPLTKLNPAEIEFIKNTVSKWPKNEVLERLKRDLQTAIQIELATIPIYLFTYYSLQRTKDADWTKITDKQLFINQAGAMLMSVAVEEMLHMSLSSNIFYAVTGEPPLLYDKSPVFPTPLPHHKNVKGQSVEIPLSKFSEEHLNSFLFIEVPEEPVDGKWPPPAVDNWESIGQFYSYIRCLICAPQLTDADFQVGSVENQIHPTNYSPNCIDTISPTENFDPWLLPGETHEVDGTTYKSAACAAEYANHPDSHAGPAQLLTVDSQLDALEAIDTICDQGEGVHSTRFDDPDRQEQSHYFKYLTLQSYFKNYDPDKYPYGTIPQNPRPKNPPKLYSDEDLKDVIAQFPENPTTACYANPCIQSLSKFVDGVYQYMLIMTETLYMVRPSYEQKRFFNEGMHRSMIWVLDKLCQKLPDYPSDPENLQSPIMAPTFQNAPVLGDPRTSSGDLDCYREAFSKLKKLGDEAVAAAQKLQDDYGQDPDSPYHEIAGTFSYYVSTAISAMEDGHSMHFPDVSRYWKSAVASSTCSKLR